MFGPDKCGNDHKVRLIMDVLSYLFIVLPEHH